MTGASSAVPVTPVAALTIAGSDSGGGAGIQADLKSFAAFGVFGTSAITAITAQNTRGVQDIHAVPPASVAAQIASVVSDFDIRAIKIGMLASTEIINTVARALPTSVPVILDPVMVATSGDRLIADDAVAALRERLIPRAACVTPNLSEAAVLAGTTPARNEQEMAAQGRVILALGASAVLVKGGHGDTAESVDLLVTAAGVSRFTALRIATQNTHGTGCSLAAAITAGVASGLPLETAVGIAKAWLSGAIAAARTQQLGGHGTRSGRGGAAPQSHGPVAHFHDVIIPARRVSQ
jgi:hydroxymethylpyrimidine/phosphomethylpyrimidine kinase